MRVPAASGDTSGAISPRGSGPHAGGDKAAECLEGFDDGAGDLGIPHRPDHRLDQQDRGR